jgi:hypothetical protein
MSNLKEGPICPRCRTGTTVRGKLLLVLESAPCACSVGLNQLRPESIPEGDLRQFIQGFYCDACGIGFLPDEMAKGAPQLWKLSKEGWRPVNPDGSLGTPRPLPK